MYLLKPFLVKLSVSNKIQKKLGRKSTDEENISKGGDERQQKDACENLPSEI